MVLSIKEREFPVIQKTKSEKLPEKTTAVAATKKVIPPDEDPSEQYSPYPQKEKEKHKHKPPKGYEPVREEA